MSRTNRVFLSTIAENQLLEKPDLKAIFQLFKLYWNDGYHDFFGKDTTVLYPDPKCSEYGIRHVHFCPPGVKPQIWSKASYNHKGELKSSEIRATSDCFLIYSVTEDRCAIIVSILIEDAHRQIRNSSLLLDYIGYLTQDLKTLEKQPILKAQMNGII